VVEWAGWTQLWPFKTLVGGIGFGSAGWIGFDPGDLVHGVNNSLDYCETCRTREERAQPRVHNVHLPFFHHSDAFAAFERAERFWLPFLLGIDPWEFWEFRRLCVKAMAYDERRKECDQRLVELSHTQEANARDRDLARAAPDSVKAQRQREFQVKLEENINTRVLLTQDKEAINQQLVNLERQLGEQVWDWAYVHQSGNERFSDFVANSIAEELFKRDPTAVDGGHRGDETLKRAATLTPKVIERVWGFVVESLRNVAKLKEGKLTREQPTGDAYRKYVARLNPHTAVSDAVQTELGLRA